VIQGLICLGPCASRDEPRTWLWLVMGSDQRMGGGLSLAPGVVQFFFPCSCFFFDFLSLGIRRDWKKSVYGE